MFRNNFLPPARGNVDFIKLVEDKETVGVEIRVRATADGNEGLRLSWFQVVRIACDPRNR